MKGTPTAAVISLSLPAVSSAMSLDSTTHGPAMTNRGRSMPTSKPQRCISGDALDLGRLRDRIEALALAKAGGRANEGGKQRVPIQRRGSEFGMELAADEPGMAGQFHHLGQVLARRTRRNLVAFRLERRHVDVVDLIAVTVALGHLRSVNFRCQRAGLHRAGLGTQPHGAAHL